MNPRTSPLRALLAAVLAPALLVTGATVSDAQAPPAPAPATRLAGTPTDPNLKVAFIGDAGTGSDARSVLGLIEKEQTRLVVHGGDLGYDSGPAAWEDMVNDVLGADFPYIYSVGNHDVEDDAWSDYQDRLEKRVAKVAGMKCQGDLGVKSTCTYAGLWVLLSGVDTLGDDHEGYIREQCPAAGNIWKIANWHKNMRAMQLGGKSDQTGWGVYEESRKCGAVIATAHEHSYGRTRTLTSTQDQTVDSSCGEPAQVCVAPGRSFVFYSGLGGQSIRDQERCLPEEFPYGCKHEWAKVYTSNQGAKPGALFMTFNVDGDPNKAKGYFKNISGQVIDEFTATASS